MATAEELLNSVLKNEASVLSASDAVFVIDGESRTINVPDSERLFGVEGDKDVERKYFQCPKIVGDNIDLSQHQIYVSYAFTTTENSTSFPDADGLYHCEDVEVSGDNITFSWLLSGNVFANPGFIAFKVMAKKSEGEELKTKWNTAPAIGTALLTVPDGEEIAEKYPDVINQIFDRLDALESGGGGGTGGTTNYENLSNKPQLNGVTLEGNKTLDQVGVLAKNQGSSNSGKYLSVGSDGNVVPADAPSGGTVDPEQIKQAVNGYLEENPVSGMTAEQEQQLNQNTSDVADLKSATNDIQKKIGVAELDVYGLTDDDYEAVDITDQFTPADYQSWIQSSNNNSGTVLSPIFKTPQKIKIFNNNTSSISNRLTRFLDGDGGDAVESPIDSIDNYNSVRWRSSIEAGETKTIYTHEWGRSGHEYMQFRWTSKTFNSWKGKFQVIAYYTDKHPQYEEISSEDGFEHDVEIKLGASAIGQLNVATATLLYIVPFVPGKKYTIKGGHWTNTASQNISVAYALYDDSLINNYYPSLGGTNGNIPVQPPIRNILSDTIVVESGASNYGKGIVTYTCPDPSETKDYPKWIAFAMSNAAKPTVEDTSITYPYSTEVVKTWIENIVASLDKNKAGWGYITKFDTLIDRPAGSKDFVNPYIYLNDNSSRYSAFQAGSSPLCGAKWVIFGDSVSDNFGGDSRDGDGFISKISREFGLIPDNRAKSGSNINDGDESYSNLCGINMLDAFLREIEEGTTEQPGYITIAYGHNSYGSHVGTTEDTSSDHRNSICGSMKYFIEKIREKCPGTVFGFVLPYQADWSKASSPDGNKDIAAGRKAMLSVLQMEGYQVPYIDMWTQSGITVDMLPDAIHPSSDQAKILYYHCLRRFMMGL